MPTPPEVIPPAPQPVPPPPPVAYIAPMLPSQPITWTALQVMTVLIITIIAGARARMARAHAGGGAAE